ncbi:hypothetical protein EON80_04970 [bacterium]|nr:MAG: hypothetical protein EON80_04970 [bacterium]
MSIRQKRLVGTLCGAIIGAALFLWFAIKPGAYVSDITVGAFTGGYFGYSVALESRRNLLTGLVMVLGLVLLYQIPLRILNRIWPLGPDCCGSVDANQGASRMVAGALSLVGTVVLVNVGGDLITKSDQQQKEQVWAEFREANRDLIESLALPASALKSTKLFTDFLFFGSNLKADSSHAEIGPEKMKTLEVLVNKFLDAGFYGSGLVKYSPEEFGAMASSLCSSFGPGWTKSRWDEQIDENEIGETMEALRN